MLNILITGHEGFIGRNVLRHLKDKHDVTLYQGDIRDWGKEYLGNPDVVLHLAALAGVRRSWDMPNDYWEVNVSASKKIFDWCNDRGIRCLYASSSSVYEWWLNPYAASKKAMEEVANENSLGMRFHTVYGHNSRPDMFYDMMLNGKVKYVTDHLRDWTHVKDVCDAIELCISNHDLCGTIDIGTGNPVKVADVAEAYGLELPMKSVTGERDVTHADTSLLLSLGWQPKYDIMEEVKNARRIPVGGKVSP